jgi:hypothetical protein
MAFHEKAGPGQVDFAFAFAFAFALPCLCLAFAFPTISLSFLAGGCAERPGAVKGAFFAASANP